MSTQKKGRIAFAVCGSFCTLEAALAAAQQLTEQGWELLPIMSFAAKQDTRFGTGQFWQERLEALTSHVVLDTLQAVEPLGPKKLVSALVIAPCTGATLARLAAGLSDTPVTLAAKSLLRVGCPVLVTVPDVVYRYVVNGASITKSRQTPKKQQDKYLAHKAFVAYVDARGIRLDARFRRITRRSFGRWGLTWLKIKECGDRETYRLFDLIPVWRKRVTDKQACDGH